MKILVIEDQEGMGIALQRNLEVLREKFPRSEISLVGTLSDGLRVISEIPHPDVTFLDLGLPDSAWMDTLAMAPTIDDTTPVIIITGHAEENVRKLLTRQEIEVIEKEPAMFSRLIGAIAAALARRRSGNLERIAANLETLRSMIPYAAESLSKQ